MKWNPVLAIRIIVTYILDLPPLNNITYFWTVGMLLRRRWNQCYQIVTEKVHLYRKLKNQEEKTPSTQILYQNAGVFWNQRTLLQMIFCWRSTANYCAYYLIVFFFLSSNLLLLLIITWNTFLWINPPGDWLARRCHEDILRFGGKSKLFISTNYCYMNWYKYVLVCVMS